MTNQISRSKPRVFILGSCVSRDILRLDEKGALDLVCYVARSSFASAFAACPVTPGKVVTSAIASSFQKRMVDIDINKRLPAMLETVAYDLLVVDLIDERFQLFQEAQGGLCTGSTELLSTGINPKQDFATRINSGTAHHFDLWRQGWDAFIAHLTAIGHIDKLRLNKVFWATKTEDGQPLTDGYDPKKIAAANTYLRKLYGHIEATLPSAQILNFPPELFVTDSKHTWGITPFHYVAPYYTAALSALTDADARAPETHKAPTSYPSSFPTGQLHLNPLGSVKQQETEGFLGGNDTPRWLYSLPINWQADPYKHHNWRFRLSSWRIMDVYIHDYITHQTASSLTKAADLALDWHRHFMDENPNVKSQWYDMATGLRATRIAWLLFEHKTGNLALSAKDFKKLDALAEAHYAMLTKSANIALNNHGLFQIFGLEMLSVYWRQGKKVEEARPFALAHLEKILNQSFTPEGVHMEASPEYHSFVLSALQRACQGSAFAQEMKPILDRAARIEPFLSMPDGTFPALGDTDNGKINHRHVRFRPDRTEQVAGARTVIKDLSASGYALARSEPSVGADEAWMLFMSGMAHVKTHKHADDLSFVYYHRGQHVFVDPGKYFYDYSDMRKYITSAQAHNTVSLEDRPVLPNEIDFVGSELHGMAVDARAITVHGTAVRPDLFTHTRVIDLVPGQRIEIRDLMRKQAPPAFINRLHIAPGLDVRADAEAMLITLKDGTTVHVTSKTEAPITILRAKKAPMGGWYSPAYNKIVGCTTLQTRHDTDVVSGGWSIELNV